MAECCRHLAAAHGDRDRPLVGIPDERPRIEAARVERIEQSAADHRERVDMLVAVDVVGREVATLVNEEMKPGRYERTFDGSGLASGVYLYKMQSGDFTMVRKFLLLK